MGLEISVQLIRTVRAKRPLVHHITNYVTVNDCANVCICCGGSPVMADAKEEMEEMASIASALVLNIGTLNSRTLESMHPQYGHFIPVFLSRSRGMIRLLTTAFYHGYTM